jgi:hypothetical protein
MAEIQSIIFAKDKFTLRRAVNWLRRNGFRTEVDEKPKTYRFRQRPPNYRQYFTKKINNGISLVFGVR